MCYAAQYERFPSGNFRRNVLYIYAVDFLDNSVNYIRHLCEIWRDHKCGSQTNILTM